jgi:hypothetical protein
VDANTTLVGMNVAVFAQGSYRNRTNVRQDSDADICVCYDGIYFPDFPSGMTLADIGHKSATYTFARYKDLVGTALVSRFGASHVSRGKKAFDIHENTYRIDADAVACLEYRKYFRDSLGAIRYYKGIALNPDGGAPLVTNFPQQQYDNGVSKNDGTSRRFKALTRIVKALRNEMADNGNTTAKAMPSFLLECLVWNWPSTKFDASNWRDMALKFFTDAWNATRTAEGCAHWMEENNIKKLFGAHNSWTREQVNAFAAAAYGYIGGK